MILERNPLIFWSAISAIYMGAATNAVSPAIPAKNLATYMYSTLGAKAMIIQATSVVLEDPAKIGYFNLKLIINVFGFAINKLSFTTLLTIVLRFLFPVLRFFFKKLWI